MVGGSLSELQTSSGLPSQFQTRVSRPIVTEVNNKSKIQVEPYKVSLEFGAQGI